jgi:hypothetical protein
MRTKKQRPWRSNAKAVEPNTLFLDSILSSGAPQEPNSAGSAPEAVGRTQGVTTLTCVLAELAGTLAGLRHVLARHGCRPPRVGPLTYRLDEIAFALGVSRRAIERERAAGRFPQPDLHVGKMPLWRTATVMNYLERGDA